VPSKADFLGFEVVADQGEHSDPFGKDDDFRVGVVEGFFEYDDEFVEFRGDACFFIEDELGIAEHTHTIQRAHESLVLFESEWAFFSEVGESADNFLVSGVVGRLALGEFYKPIFITAVGEFGFDIVFAAAEEEGFDFFS